MPMIDEHARDLIQDTAPKVKVITENLVETSHMVRSKAQEFDVTASDLNAKTRAQAARVDGMVTSVLNTTAEISETMQRAIKVPVREFSGLVNGFKAGWMCWWGGRGSLGQRQNRYARSHIIGITEW